VRQPLITWALSRSGPDGRVSLYFATSTRIWTSQDGHFTIRQHVEDVVAFILALAAGPVRLIGHSRGGHIVFRVAALHGRLLRAVVLAEPGGELDESLGGQPSTGAPSATLLKAAQLVRNGEVEEALRGFAANTGGPGAWERRPEPRRQIARDNARTLLGQIHEQRASFSLAAVQAIRTPILLMGGAETEPQFVAILNALESAIADAKRVTIPSARHQMSFDNPAAFNAAVLEFLDAT
jgi:esterase